MSTATAVQQTELAPVRTRVSWSSVFAGAVVALAVYVLLALFGTALGFTIADRGATDRTLSIYAAIWALVSVLVSLFLGGFVASQCAVGQTRAEAAIHGVTLWGLVFTALLWLLASGLSLGFGSLLGAAVGQLDRGLPPADRTETGAAPTPAEQLAQKVQQEWREHRAAAAWWSLVGILLSMIASVTGTLTGVGRTLVLQRFIVTNGFFRRAGTDAGHRVLVQ
jgi:hypothetical protein